MPSWPTGTFLFASAGGEGGELAPWQIAVYLAAAVVLVLLNGFFVAAEFSLVKVRGSRLDVLVKERRPLARLARWLGNRLDASLSACQLGITMASLALGWVAEPAFVVLLRIPLEAVGASPGVISSVAVAIGFLVITALHLVIGEQAPKIFAIRRPERLILWCAAPLVFFYFLFYPLLVALNGSTTLLLRLFGVGGAGHETPHSEAEIRALLSQAHAHGELTRSEHTLLNAVFEFDDLNCRRVMVPRGDVAFFDADMKREECLSIISYTKHTRYPVCERSLDRVIGVAHIKDILIAPAEGEFALRSIMRPPRRVPETMQISRLLRHFQKTHQLLALVVDEYGTVIGIVTLENVLEQIVGPVEDEFDAEPPEISPSGPGEYIVQGSALLSVVNKKLSLDLSTEEADTVSGLLMERMGRILEQGDRIELAGAVAEVLDVRASRATRVRFTLAPAGTEAPLPQEEAQR